MNAEQIQRIAAMERTLEETSQAIENLSAALEAYAAVQQQLKELAEYYESERWIQDYDDDCAGRLPKELKRGVLSQDTVYNLLAENDCIKAALRELSQD